MKIFATALAGVLSVCVLASAPAKAAPYDPFDANPGEDYYAGQPYDSPSYRATQGYYGQGQAAGSTEQAQVAPIPRELVPFNGGYAPGTLVVSTAERRLYLVLGDGMALRYGVGVGRPGFTWSGTKTITAKREWPSWTPPKEMLARRPDLPRYMAGGIDNPLGARAMYIGGTLYRIHVSNEPDTIGQAVSSGCIRMTNDDVTDLYSRVKVGAKVVVLN
ncbi:L,D-transpeptidase [Methylobacterium ajmalii]|jgi:lipoprotein-anchoring transpeptidase ErfK/SrfK|uniref:L,D-transpeptidase n=1 Tax=Methylobacterium ajmalii TaxID=2738439 RepID=UPI00190B981D|nr:L,D-transpeptidase [Methylobacterium ajmalii]MBK3398355.1 L,D-transpeptidase [Methylobacterium ajmalii]MBK3410490.1 L,D-transpeptidase [Methylobacterium ajmalii]MBK3426185.1 L,D-transpeptidase [Methylobacterium ajmalii]MBZ6416887.1 L,D-transpeptidase [Methylobacterium sp.]